MRVFWMMISRARIMGMPALSRVISSWLNSRNSVVPILLRNSFFSERSLNHRRWTLTSFSSTPESAARISLRFSA